MSNLEAWKHFLPSYLHAVHTARARYESGANTASDPVVTGVLYPPE
jgi:hypothetical protein